MIPGLAFHLSARQEFQAAMADPGEQSDVFLSLVQDIATELDLHQVLVESR